MNQAALYTTANDLQRRDARDFSDEFSDEIGKMSGCCLDIGSGPGDAGIDLILPKLNKNASLVCSNISEKMVKFGKEKYKDNERLSFFRLNIELPNLPKELVEQFDHVTSFYCLHWCQDMCQVVENIFNLLRPGGSAFLTFIASFPGKKAYPQLAALPRYQPYMKDANRRVPVFQDSEQPGKALKDLIKDVGFEVHHCSVREKSYTFDSLEILRKFLLPLNPFLEHLPTNLAEEYKKDLVNKFAKLSIMIKKNNKNEDEYSVLCIYKSFVVYLKKPLTK